MPVIVIGLQLHQVGSQTDQLVKCAATKLVASDADPDTSEVGVLPLRTQVASTHEEAQATADRLLDECADQLGIADRNELVTVVRD